LRVDLLVQHDALHVIGVDHVRIVAEVNVLQIRKDNGAVSMRDNENLFVNVNVRDVTRSSAAELGQLKFCLKVFQSYRSSACL
jgi:hypothetical protein